MEALRQDSGRGCCSIWPSKWSAAWSRDQARGGVGPPGPGARGEGPPQLYHPQPPVVQPSTVSTSAHQCPPVPEHSTEPDPFHGPSCSRCRGTGSFCGSSCSGCRLRLRLRSCSGYQLLQLPGDPAPSVIPAAPDISPYGYPGNRLLQRPGDRLLRRHGDRLLRRPGDRLLRRLCSCQICLDPVPGDTSTGGLLID